MSKKESDAFTDNLLLEEGAINLDNSLSDLQRDLSTERKARREERFLWIVSITILIDFIVFRGFNNWGDPIAILVLEVFLLFMITKSLDIAEVCQLINKWVSFFGKSS